MIVKIQHHFQAWLLYLDKIENMGEIEKEKGMRLIDGDALLENYNLKDATKYGNKNAEQQYKSYSTMMMYEIADMIEDAPTIEPNQWIPCSDSEIN